MPENSSSSSLVERMSPNAARLVLALLVVLAALLVWIGLGISEPVKRAGPSDLDTYQRVVEGLRGGQNYYSALHAALLDGGYGTLSPLNWRPPLFLTLLSWLPTLAAAQALLEVLTAAAWVMAVAYLYRRGNLAAATIGAILLPLSLLSIFADRAELSFELCAGTLLLISVSAYGLGWRWLGFAVAVLALFVRELAVLYAVVCLVTAIKERWWREVVGWAVALTAYGAFYLWHWNQLSALIGPADHGASVDWLQFGGLRFVLRTAAFNGILLVLPYWAAALALVVGLAGLVTMPRALATVVLYLLLFLVYGRPENGYWGALYAPLIVLGIARAPSVFSALLVRSRQSSAAERADALHSGSSPPSADGSVR